MKLEQSFEVAAPLEQVWDALIDVERVTPCLPGASITGRNEDGSYNGEFKVKVGPTSSAYGGKLSMESVDAEGHTATMQANGTDKRGGGGAKATIVSTVAPAGDGRTKVEVSTDYHITGRLARFGRGGMIEEISGKLLNQFSTNLQTMLVEGEASEAAGTEAAAAGEVSAATATPDAKAASSAEQSSDAPAGAGAPNGSVADAPPVAQPATGSAPPSSPAAETEPLSAFSLVGPVVMRRVKDNPAPIAALAIGLVLALLGLRRRS